MNTLCFVDVEAYGGSPVTGRMTEFGAVAWPTRATFHGHGDDKDTFLAFSKWLGEQFPLDENGRQRRVIFVSDNPAFDFQWINCGFHKHLGFNPFGHSARRIGDFYAGLCGNFRVSQQWKRLRITPHDHNPVHDAMGNVEAFDRILAGER